MMDYVGHVARMGEKRNAYRNLSRKKDDYEDLDVGPDVWPLEYPQCSGARQSPINLEADDMYRLVVSKQLRWHGYRTRPHSLTLTNNRHTIQVSGKWKMTPSISGGPLEGEYTFSQLHFHWGSSDTIGSEHTVRNVRYLTCTDV
ncbi:hypothetical protein B7P43_G02400 [Cryptotermes secundus]|uniref:Alpha-carbonic anhydrase domain-containing protein n=1 Tax=Cryptotermes secundus TaxID=105785 RepID=A0A2J7R435_9NEOP|nr:hypothetical protein B7P43_G02400 [Cryptotermes secundus]